MMKPAGRLCVGIMTIHNAAAAPPHRSTSGFVAVQKLLGRQGAEIVERGAEPQMIPIPPGEPVHALTRPGCEAVANELCRNTADDRVGSDIAGHDGPCPDHGAVADGDAGQDRRAMADPDLVSDYHPLFATPFKEVFLIRSENRRVGQEVVSKY